MTTYTETGRALDFLLSEAPGTLSRGRAPCGRVD